MDANETLSLSGTEGVEKSTPSRARKTKKAVKKNNSFKAAKAKSNDIKADEGKTNPPEYKDASGGRYVGKDMAKFFNAKADPTTMTHRDFTDCDLSGASFRGCILQGSIFKGAKIDEETDFAGADCRWADFRGAKWPEGGYENVKWGDEQEDGSVTNMANLFECDGVTR